MAISSENGSDMVMPVAPMYGGNAGFGGLGGGDGWWILLLLLFAGGGWGFGGGFGGLGAAGADGAILYPWMNQGQQVNDGFRDQMLNTNISGIQASVNGIGNQLCTGFAGVNATVSNGFAQAEASANARQIADMQQGFANQTVVTNGMSNLATQLSQCLKKSIYKVTNTFGLKNKAVGTCAA